MWYRCNDTKSPLAWKSDVDVVSLVNEYAMASSPDPVTALDKPVSSLTSDAYITLCFSLTTSQGLGGRNWEGVAGKIGLKMDQIMAMKNHTEPNKGRLFLTTWENLNRSGATVKKLIFALQSLKMLDCIEAFLKDPSISVEDIESALSECEQLVQTGRLSSQFPSNYSTVEFSNALYPPPPAPAPSHHWYPYHHTQHDHCPPFPRPAPPVIEEQCVTEEMPPSADDVQSDSISMESQFVPNSIFISHYPCPKDDEQAKQLDELTTYLRQYDYTVYYDKYCTRDIQQCGGINLWKEKHIRRAETILVICTPEYFEDDENALMERGHSKIEVDRKLLRSIAYGNNSERLIPVLLDEFKNVRNCIPTFVQPFALHFWPSKKQDLVFAIAKMAKYQLPEIPAHERKVLKPIVIQVPRRKELSRPMQVQTVEGKELKSKTIHSHEKKVLKPTVIPVYRRKDGQSQPREMKSSNIIESSKEKEVQSQLKTKKGPFRILSKLKKKVIKSK